MIEARCRQCSGKFKLNVSETQYNFWKSGALIQKVMPNLTADERELLISGICGGCFDNIFRDDS